MTADTQELRSEGDKTKPHVPQAHVDKLAYTVHEACAASGFRKSTAWKLIQTGKLPSRMVGGRRLILRRDLEALLEGGER